MRASSFLRPVREREQPAGRSLVAACPHTAVPLLDRTAPGLDIPEAGSLAGCLPCRRVKLCLALCVVSCSAKSQPKFQWYMVTRRLIVFVYRVLNVTTWLVVADEGTSLLLMPRPVTTLSSTLSL